MTGFKDFKIGDFVYFNSRDTIFRIESNYAERYGYKVRQIAEMRINNEIILVTASYYGYLTNTGYILVSQDIRNKLLKLLTFQ